MGGLSLDDGGKITLIASFNKGEATTKLLATLPAGPGASDLVGLPAVAPRIAYAARGDGISNVAMVPVLLNIISNPSFVPPVIMVWQILDLILAFDQGLLEKSLPDKERQELVSAFEGICKELKGLRVGLYPTSDPKRFGQSALVGILDLGDVEKHLAAWSHVVKALNRAGERASEGSTQKPQFTYLPGAENIGDRPVDLIALQLIKVPEQPVEGCDLVGLLSLLGEEVLRGLITRAESDQTADGKDFSTSTFGPDGNKIRLVVVGKQVAVLVGSDLDLLKQTVANLEAGKKGLADEKLTNGHLSRLSAERTIEFHFKVGTQRWLSWWGQTRPEEMTQGLLSLVLTIQGDGLQVEIVPDKSAIKSFFGLADDSSEGRTPRKPE